MPQVEWLTTRGQFSGAIYGASSATVAIPQGLGDSPDKRRGGAWYVGVQAR